MSGALPPRKTLAEAWDEVHVGLQLDDTDEMTYRVLKAVFYNGAYLAMSGLWVALSDGSVMIQMRHAAEMRAEIEAFFAEQLRIGAPPVLQ